MTFTEKYLRAAGTVAVGGRQVKRDHVSIEPEIEETVRKAAAEYLPRLLPSPDDETPPASDGTTQVVA
jgi:hypothetical protein